MKTREALRLVLEQESAIWGSKTWDELAEELFELRAYEAGIPSGTESYQVEVHLVELNAVYVQIMVAVDDGTLLGGLCPLTRALVIQRGDRPSTV